MSTASGLDQGCAWPSRLDGFSTDAGMPFGEGRAVMIYFTTVRYACR